MDSARMSRLEKVLWQQASLRTVLGLYHTIMQLSLANYLMKNYDIDDLKLEHSLIYGEAAENKWPADVAITYRDFGRKIVEMVEVETIPLQNYRLRLGNVVSKAEKVDKALKFKELNPIFKDVDEVRFSVCVNSEAIPETEKKQALYEFAASLRRMTRKAGIAIKIHNVYVLNTSMQGSIVDALPGVYARIIGDDTNRLYATRRIKEILQTADQSPSTIDKS